MSMQAIELKRVVGEQAELYDAMARSIWGDRLVMALTAATIAGFGMGLLFSDKWRTRFVGTVLYAAAAGMELYAAMSPKTREQRAAPAPTRPEAHVA